VKKTSLGAISAIVVSLCFSVSTALAQVPGGVPPAQPMPPAAGARIAFIDVGKIFKNDARFKALMEDMKRDVQGAENLVREERDRIGKLEESLRDYQKGTQAYQQMEEQITARKADLTVKVQIQGKQFQQRQAKIYYNVYQEILQVTDYFCKQHGIDVVLQIKGDPVDSEVAESVIPFINKQVVWYADDLDITKQILGELNRTAINPPRSADERGAPGRPASPFNGNQPPQQPMPPR
jgi:Skp family chaperone for outer membrane proteins